MTNKSLVKQNNWYNSTTFRMQLYQQLLHIYKAQNPPSSGILSKLSGILAEHKIGIFAVSTYNTDYILVKEENYETALTVLASEGYTVI